MALRVWLPLNGNFNNQGLSANTSNFSLPTNASWGAGKFGNNLITSNANTTASFSDLSGLKTFTVSLWWKLTPDKTFTTWADIIHFNTTGGSTGTFRVEVSNTSGTATNWFGYGMTSGGLCTQAVTPGVWYHDVVTVENGNLKRYLNGVYKGGVTVTADVALGDSIKLGDPGMYVALADVRLYDECLSQKQIKEISKGLVAHYKLDTARAINNLKRNVSYGTYNNFSSSGSTCTVVDTGTTYQGAKIYRMTYTPNDTSLSSVKTALHSHGVTTSGQTFTAGIKYCYWTLCKPISHPDTIVGGVASNIGYWYEIPMKEYENGWYIVGQKRTGNAPENKSDTIFTSFKTPSATSGTPIIIDFCCPHLIEGYDEILPEFDYQGTVVAQEQDCSGNGYTAKVTGSLTFNLDSPRYSGCTAFDANTSYLKLPAMTTAGFANSFTIIYWAKITDMNGKMAWGFGDGNRLNIYPSSSVFCCNTGDGSNNQYKNNGTAVAFSPYNNSWHQYAMVGDESTNKLYIDGIYAGTATTYKGITGTQMYISGWDTGTSYKWTGGTISDFRFYATALSADDILTMYKNSGIIDNKGNVYAYEFKEE